jgi:S1-C subfamily serine protease
MPGAVHRTSLTASLLALALIAIGGCGNNSHSTTSTPGGSSGKQADPQSSVVYVKASYKNRTTQGTGFVYDAQQGLILTSDHAVEAAPAITVTDRDGQVMHGHVLSRAQCHDFAVVKLHPIPAGLSALTFADSSKVSDGATVSSLSYALTTAGTKAPALVSTHGTVSATNVSAKLHRMLPAISPLIAHQVPLNANGSGSPLLDRSGRVVGLNTLVGFDHTAGAVQGLNYALASNFVYQQLRALRAGTDRSLAGWRSEHRCHRAMDMIAGLPYQHTGMHDQAHGHGMGGSMPGHGKDGM